MPEGDILHDTAGDCSDKELLTARLPLCQRSMEVAVMRYWECDLNNDSVGLSESDKTIRLPDPL